MILLCIYQIVLSFKLLSVSSDKLDDYEAALESAIKEQMAKSITESNLLQAQEAAKKSLFNGGFTDNEREMLGQLLTNSIVVNNVVDKDATNSAKENAKQSVSTVRILQGQVLIQEGHIITQEDLRILELIRNRWSIQVITINFIVIGYS